MNCQNCGATHGCSCQERVASDGKKCCSTCIMNYEMSKGTGQPSPQNYQGSPMQKNDSMTPIVNSIMFNNVNDFNSTP